MLAHVFSAFVKLRFVNYDCFFFSFFKCANGPFMWTVCVCECVCVRAPVWVYVCFRLTVYPHPFYVCGATRFISTCLQNYRSMPVLDLWNIIDTQRQCNFSSVQQLSNDTSASVNLREVCVCVCVYAYVCVCLWERMCTFLCRSVTSKLPDTFLKKNKKKINMYVCDMCEPPTPQWVCFFFHLKDNHMYSFEFFFPLWFLVICKFVQKKETKTNCVDIYVLHIIMLSSITTE